MGTTRGLKEGSRAWHIREYLRSIYPDIATAKEVGVAIGLSAVSSELSFYDGRYWTSKVYSGVYCYQCLLSLPTDKIEAQVDDIKESQPTRAKLEAKDRKYYTTRLVKEFFALIQERELLDNRIITALDDLEEYNPEAYDNAKALLDILEWSPHE